MTELGPPADQADSTQPPGKLVPIGRFARLAGLSVPQLRHYDRRGILSPAARDRRSGYRYYAEAQAAAAHVIALLRSIDVPLADVQELLEVPEPERVRKVFAEHRLRVERRLTDAQAALESIDRIITEGELMDTTSEERCSFCRRLATEAAFRLTGPHDARICAACVGLAREVLEIDSGSEGKAEWPSSLPAEEQPPGWLACAFCGRDKTNVRKLVAGPDVAICDGCLAGVAA